MHVQLLLHNGKYRYFMHFQLPNTYLYEYHWKSLYAT